MSTYSSNYNKPYSQTGWKDFPNETTPITAEILNENDRVIEQIDNFLNGTEAFAQENKIEKIVVNGTEATITDKTASITTGGEGGTSDYTQLSNKPSINNVTLNGNKSLADLGITTTDNNYTNADKSKLAGIEANANNYSLPKATTSTLGGVKVDGTTVTVSADGTISASGGGGSDVPIATTEIAGKVKPDGTTISVTEDGTISVIKTDLNIAYEIKTKSIGGADASVYVDRIVEGERTSTTVSYADCLNVWLEFPELKIKYVSPNWVIEFKKDFVDHDMGTTVTWHFQTRVDNLYTVKKESGEVEVDSELSLTSTNPVQNKVIAQELGAIDTKLSNIGEIKYKSPEGLDIVSGTFVNVNSLVLTSGVWLVYGIADWAKNGNGDRLMSLRLVETPSAGSRKDFVTTKGVSIDETGMNMLQIMNITEPTTIYQHVEQNSGVTLKVYPAIYAVKIANV